MIESNVSAGHIDRGAEHLTTAERLLGCSTTTLPDGGSDRAGTEDRIQVLLERLVSVARGANGVVLIAGDDGRSTVRAIVGLEPAAYGALPGSLDELTFGLVVHGAELDGQGRHGDGSGCHHGLADPDSRMAVCLPLAWDGKVVGAVQVGFAELRTLERTEIRQVGTIAEHIASVTAAECLARENAAHRAEIARVSAQLAEVDRMKADFLSMVSHELRTPLTAIIGYTDLLLRQIHGPLTERQGRHQQSVKKAAHRLLALINDLLDLNRLESSNVSLTCESISLVDAIKRAVRQCELHAEQRAVGLRVDVPLVPVAVNADTERLHQILVNLLDNAIKFTPEHGSVTVQVTRSGTSVTVAVTDTGVGVPADQLDLIWDRFHQADSSTRRRYGGTGLGLAIVRHLVELHGGSVSVASPGPGAGSTFSFTMPCTVEALDLTPAGPHDAIPTGRRHSPIGTVLIVDDEPDNREVIASIVHDVLGHAVLTATNGQEALEQAARCPDLVLLDLRMPGMSGFEVARTLKAQPATREIPILAITALDDEGDRREATDAGCAGCVTKPFSEASLAAAVAAILHAPERGATR